MRITGKQKLGRRNEDITEEGEKRGRRKEDNVMRGMGEK